MALQTETKYKNFIHAGRQIAAKEGVKALFGERPFVSSACFTDHNGSCALLLTKSVSAGAGANILRGVASAGVLAIYDK